MIFLYIQNYGHGRIIFQNISLVFTGFSQYIFLLPNFTFPPISSNWPPSNMVGFKLERFRIVAIMLVGGSFTMGSRDCNGVFNSSSRLPKSCPINGGNISV